jgi:hypothetical protein
MVERTVSLKSFNNRLQASAAASLKIRNSAFCFAGVLQGTAQRTAVPTS